MKIEINSLDKPKKLSQTYTKEMRIGTIDRDLLLTIF